ncbi:MULTISPECIES: Rrf2 family transcriptional regulator [unclassified Ruminococcus]|uniref:RrF2 family transcriptional regulator n=1 Tax=unclassified Ruminococcus TaxID=2608920 RepID=UPI000931D317|nr:MULTISPECIES: Rrf2 family transcriptional regulator [unclassified Ruminococcus]
MKISTRVELGIVALADIAVNSENGNTVSSAEIAERQNISQKYLEQIILGLRQGGFVKGQKGSHGGYLLSRPAEKIFLSEILNALDNNILADTYEADEAQANDIRSSVNSCLWDKMNSYMRRFTEQMTLADLIKEYKDSSGSGKTYMYYI